MRAKPVNFERKSDPKNTLRIGAASIIPEITSYDLKHLSIGWDAETNSFSEEEYEMFMEDYKKDDPFDYNKSIIWLRKVALALKGHIEFGETFDWKQLDAANEYLAKNQPTDKPYAYEGSPESDQWFIVWSDIELPNAKAIGEY